MKVYIKTYGCQMNERDSEAVSAMLRGRGYEPAAGEADADVIIVNTCSVRAKAEDKALGKLGLLAASKREFPSRIVGAMGCMVQRMGEEILKKVGNLDFAVGTHRLSALPSVLDAVGRGNGPIVDIGEEEPCPDDLRAHETDGSPAFVTILQGCNRGCAYCVVPSVRGQEWSRPAQAIIEEIKDLASRNVREVTLLGQSVTSYGRSNSVWDDGYVSPRRFMEPLPRLLEAIAGIPGLERIRFTSSHPSGCTDELVRAMKELPAVCEHLHLPLQSGSDRILKMMKRGYTVEEYRATVTRLRTAIPEMAVTTDVIAGFPSESMEDFEMTRGFMEEIGFDNSFIFKYSPRPDTPAGLADDVPQVEKMRRNQVLLEDQDRRGLSINERLAGRELEVLVEGASLRNSSRWSGRTRTNKIVVFEPGSTTRPGDIANVRIERATAQTLYGSIADCRLPIADCKGFKNSENSVPKSKI